MAEESYFDRFFNRENNQGLYNLGDTLSELPANALDYLKQEGQVAKDQIGSLADFAFDNRANDAIEEFMARESETQGGQAFRKGLEFFRGLGETGLDYASVPFEKAQEGIEFLQGDSDFVLAEKEKAKQIENQRLIELDPLGEFSGMGPQIIPDFESPDFESLNIDPDILSGLDVEVDADNAIAASRKEKALAEKKAQDAADSTIRMSQQGPNFVPVAEDEKSSKENQAQEDKKVIEDGFSSAMKDFMAASGRDLPSKNESRSDSIARYKKEFEEITGIDASGKVDKSNFLMAMGLNLMQNKAGKDFNFSKIMDSGAKAVEDAMPMLTKAADKAEAASLAAGKFALGEIKAGESAAAAFAKEVRTNNYNYQLKKYELDEKFRLEGLKQDGKSNEMKNVSRISIGAGDLKIGMGNVNGVSKFSTAPTDAGKIVNAYNKYTEGQVDIGQMQDALTALANRGEGPLPAKLIDSIKTLSVKLGLADPKVAFGEKGISAAEEFEVYQQATINAFKKLILQESQISNLDLKTLFESFGDAGFMASPEKSKLAIDKMMDYFSAKKRTLQPVLNDFSDKDFFRSESDFEKTQEKLKAMGASITGQATSGEDGRLRIDLSAIPKLNVED